jgi:hypothetical protein
MGDDSKDCLIGSRGGDLERGGGGMTIGVSQSNGDLEPADGFQRVILD